MEGKCIDDCEEEIEKYVSEDDGERLRTLDVGAKKQAAQTVMHAPWATLQAIAAGV
ncbi:16286_t:CDS:2 [Entrophospora sp. SA101]|nr:16286_t:CDS:2 [Entrophospora sp. SA101]